MKTYGCIIQNGVLVNPSLEADLKKAEGLRVHVSIQRAEKKRTPEQNAYLWGLVYPMLAQHYQENPGDFIRDVLNATKAEMTQGFVHELCKTMFNGGHTTTGMNTARMTDYIEHIRAYALMNHKLDIPEPEEKS